MSYYFAWRLIQERRKVKTTKERKLSQVKSSQVKSSQPWSSRSTDTSTEQTRADKEKKHGRTRPDEPGTSDNRTDSQTTWPRPREVQMFSSVQLFLPPGPAPPLPGLSQASVPNREALAANEFAGSVRRRAPCANNCRIIFAPSGVRGFADPLLPVARVAPLCTSPRSRRTRTSNARRILRTCKKTAVRLGARQAYALLFSAS